MLTICNVSVIWSFVLTQLYRSPRWQNRWKTLNCALTGTITQIWGNRKIILLSWFPCIRMIQQQILQELALHFYVKPGVYSAKTGTAIIIFLILQYDGSIIENLMIWGCLVTKTRKSTTQVSSFIVIHLYFRYKTVINVSPSNIHLQVIIWLQQKHKNILFADRDRRKAANNVLEDTMICIFWGMLVSLQLWDVWYGCAIIINCCVWVLLWTYN